jgi:glucokinase
MSQVLAIDIGGTKMAAALVDADGIPRCVNRTPTVPGGDAETLFDALVELLDTVMAQGESPDLIGVGIGSGGPMLWPSGVISPLNIPGWQGFPLRQRVSERYAGIPVRIHNDAIAVAVAEHWKGAGRGVGHLLGMVVSTGVGGGLILGGRIVDGASGNAGHIGHVIVDPVGPVCVCGARGCLESIARGPALAVWAYEQGWRSDTGGTGRDLAEDARSGDAIARAAFARAGRALGIAIASAIALTDLEMVSIGGGISDAGPLLFEPLEESLAEHTGLAFTKVARVISATMGQEAGLVGAAAFVHAADTYWTPTDH